MAEKLVTKIPKSEKSWTLIRYKSNEYVITSNLDRTTYFIYKIIDGKFLKLGKGKTPYDLDKYWKEDKPK
jgi:hypothetical protein